MLIKNEKPNIIGTGGQRVNKAAILLSSNHVHFVQLHLELAEVYRHLCRLVNNLRSTESTDSTPPGDEECPDDVISTSGLLLLLHQLEEFLQRQQNTIVS